MHELAPIADVVRQDPFDVEEENEAVVYVNLARSVHELSSVANVVRQYSFDVKKKTKRWFT
ncbi:MAG TPA: hypothetical protein VHX14_09835 [Thermoanaerobaculia bacterium]|jgi:hypothetical protein|nr:hypothetical protein [Thermoanaerobaculia bacterium]